MVGNKRKTTGKLQFRGRFGKLKSHGRKMIYVKTPGGNTVVQFRKIKPGKAKCASCGAVLKGTARARPFEMQNMPLTMKRPTRPYGGYFCSKCTRDTLVKKTRANLIK